MKHLTVYLSNHIESIQKRTLRIILSGLEILLKISQRNGLYQIHQESQNRSNRATLFCYHWHKQYKDEMKSRFFNYMLPQRFLINSSVCPPLFKAQFIALQPECTAQTKRKAKKFYTLLYLMLIKNNPNIDPKLSQSFILYQHKMPTNLQIQQTI